MGQSSLIVVAPTDLIGQSSHIEFGTIVQNEALPTIIWDSRPVIVPGRAHFPKTVQKQKAGYRSLWDLRSVTSQAVPKAPLPNLRSTL